MLLFNVNGLIISPVVFLSISYFLKKYDDVHTLFLFVWITLLNRNVKGSAFSYKLSLKKNAEMITDSAHASSLALQLRGTSVFTVGFRPSPWRSTFVQCSTPATPLQIWLWTDTTVMLSAEALSITTRSPQLCCSASASAPWRPAVTA